MIKRTVCKECGFTLTTEQRTKGHVRCAGKRCDGTGRRRIEHEAALRAALEEKDDGIIRCPECKWWRRFLGEVDPDDEGTCHRYAPRDQPHGKGWPITDEAGFCGDAEEKE